MSRTSTLSSLLSAQRKPFLIIAAGGQILHGNRPFEKAFGVAPEQLRERHCCQFDAVPAAECRHQRFFRDLEPYVETRQMVTGNGEVQLARVQGFPVVDTDGQLYLGESLQLLQGAAQTHQIVGNSPRLQALISDLTRAAATEAAVLLHGETGSGKELAAEFIHTHSSRAGKPFVIVDCTVLSEDLFESELFGHTRGAFTGAVGNKNGLMELADGGTLFFDEIGELPLSQQPKLLRAIETGVFRPVGSTQTKRADVRILSATHRDLKAMAQRGEFRQDLFYRLAVLPILLPPLRERREDIPLLVEHLLQELPPPASGRFRVNRETLRKLLTYGFPGNIRELRNLLHLAVALSAEGEIGPEAIRLPEGEPEPQTTNGPNLAMHHPHLEGLSPVETAEAHYILELMQRHHGNRREVAASMSISERTLYRKLKRYQLNTP